MSILLRRTSAALALLALALCLPQGSLMLCASENGHIALEALCDPGSAVEHAEAPATEAAGTCDCDSGCGPCQDSQVGTELTAGRIREHSAKAADPLVAPMLAPVAAVAAPRVAFDTPRRSAPAVSPRPLSRVQAGTCLRI